ncbi:restriction endonuclease subunit S [Streptomyces sp. NPDC047821]|uniref:restriction endonuclease subunit S n=1 Tax=Streptomyces sp. NPDC047821 TaxID=3365488 RepID=UPI00371F7282
MPATRVCRLGDLGEITPSPSSDLFTNLAGDVTGTPVIAPGDIEAGRVVERARLRSLASVTHALERFRVRPGDLVVVRQGAVGRTALIEERSRDWIYHSACVRVRPDPAFVDPGFLAAYLAYPPVLDQLLARTNVGTVTTVTSSVLAGLEVVLPALEDQKTLARALREVDTQMDLHRQTLTRLEALKPALMSHALGGEVPGGRSEEHPGAPAARRVARGPRVRRMS